MHLKKNFEGFRGIIYLFALTALSFLFYAGDNPPGGSPGSDHVLVGNTQQIPLLVTQLDTSFSYRFHTGCHVVVSIQIQINQEISLHHLQFF